MSNGWNFFGVTVGIKFRDRVRGGVRPKGGVRGREKDSLCEGCVKDSFNLYSSIFIFKQKEEQGQAQEESRRRA